MIGTFLGLVSYMSDANTPATELDKSNVRVYPNPVKPDYNGVIAVDGLTLNAEVKITTAVSYTHLCGCQYRIGRHVGHRSFP